MSDSPSGSLLRKLLTFVGVFAGIYGVAFVGMLALRGKSFEQQFADRWENGESLDVPAGTLFPEDNRPVPLSAKWESVEAMLAEAPDVELVEREISIEFLDYTIQLPADASIETDFTLPTILLTPDTELTTTLMRYDMSHRRDHIRDYTLHTVKQLLYADDEVLVVEFETDNPAKFDIYFNRRVGLRDVAFFLKSTDQDFSTSHSVEDCLLALKCGLTLTPTDPVPTDVMSGFASERLKWAPEDAQAPEDITFLEIYRGSNSLLRLLENCPNLETLHLRDEVRLIEEDVLRIAALPALRKLWLNTRNNSFTEVHALGKATQLEELLVLLNDHVERAPLGQLTSLRRLALEAEPTQQRYAFLSNLTKLEELRLSGGVEPMTFADLMTLVECKPLTRLALNGKLDVKALNALQYLPPLTHLVISDPYSFEPEEGGRWESIATQSKLESLEIIGSRFSDTKLSLPAERLETWSQLPLKRLVLANLAVDDAGMEQLAKIESLEYLKLEGLPITEAGLEQVGQLKHLQSLEIFKCEQLSEDAIGAFDRSHPDLRVEYGSSLRNQEFTLELAEEE